FFVSNILLLTHQSFSTIFKPFAAVNFLKGNISILAKKYYELGKWSSNISGILFVFITFFPTYLISLFSNIENDHVFIVGLLLLSTSNFIYITIGQSTSLLQMIGGYKFEAINTFILIIINLILNLFLIPIYGAIGAAISTLIAVTVRVILQTIQIKNLIGLIVINQYQFIIFVLGLTLALASYKMVIYTEVKLILLLFCIVGLIYFLLTENSIDEFRSEIIKLLVHKK
ncbi:MAG: polysaccharide biosynthesis C-terminal domain-containing protein, partial [Bacteroidetes bacterium]|nr:polysaccharide biosynthesis C-terminal domain-containing protein [Bacteroidota bacterium]